MENEGTEIIDQQLPLTEQAIEAAKRELRLARRGAARSFQQLLEKVKDLIATRGSRTVMRVYMEQASEQIIEVRGITGRLLAMLDETEKLREESSFQRLEYDLESMRVSLEQHLRGREKDPPSSVASTELPKLSSAFKKRETDPQAVDINARNLDFELANSEQALVLKHEREMTKYREELQRREYEVRLRLQEQQFQHEVH